MKVRVRVGCVVHPTRMRVLSVLFYFVSHESHNQAGPSNQDEGGRCSLLFALLAMSLYYIDALSRKSPMLLLVQMLPSLIEIKSRQNFSLYQLSIQYLSNKKGKWGLGNAFQGLHVPPYCLHLLKKSIT